MLICIKNKALAGLLAVALAVLISGCDDGNNNNAIGGTLKNPPPPTSADWELVWSDDFDGTTLDLSKWDVQIGDGSLYDTPRWGNEEEQFYTPENITLEDGKLVITARVEDRDGYEYTSGRIRTQGKFDFTFGRVEASIKVPEGVGLWGAFWTLGSDPSPYGDWAGKGEIDILESFGQATPFAQAALHFGMAAPLNVTVLKKNNEIDPTDGFHQYAVEWDALQIRWFIDGVNFYTIKAETYWNYYFTQNGFVAGGSAAPFDVNQHIILNLAVGGLPAGTPDPDSDVFPGQMLVEYVRVYQCPLDPQNTGLGCANSIDPVDPFLITIDGPGTAPPQEVATASYDLYIDAPGTLFEDTNGVRELAIAVNGPLELTQVAASDESRGTVIDVVTTGGGNFQIIDNAGETFELFGMGTAEDPAIYGGELKFDVFIFASGTDASGSLQVQMDSGFPDVGFVALPLSDIPKGQWTTVSLKISDVIQTNIGFYQGGPLDMAEIVSLIVLEPTKAAHLQFDNIRLVCGAPESRPCGIAQVATVSQDVFIDAVDPVWNNGIRAADSGSGFADYSDGSNPDGTNKVEWQVVADPDSSRGQVIDVTFNDSSENGVFFIQSSEGVNLTAYAEGEVVFDLIVTDYDGSTEGMTMKIDCTFPCTSGDKELGMVADGVWETIKVPVQELTLAGLDVAAVNTGLVIFPTSEAGTVNFRLDNIRWNPTTDIVVGPRPPIGYSSDFEDLDPAADRIGEGWTSFVNVTPVSDPFYSYGAFPTPNGSGGIANVASGEGGGDPQFGDQHLALFSDYTNTGAHDNGDLVDTLSFQQYRLLDTDSGTFRLTFDVKAPVVDGIAQPSTASAYIRTLDTSDPQNVFPTSNVEFDLSDVDSSDWVNFTIELPVDAVALQGQTLQFGFSNQATNNDASTLLFDNVLFELDESTIPMGISYSQDFEELNATSATALANDGWLRYTSVWDGDVGTGTFLYDYQGEAANGASGSGQMSAIAGGEGGPEQGLQYLNVYSDYDNRSAQENGENLFVNIFQQRTVTAFDIGKSYTFSFDVKAPFTGGIAPPTTATAFIATIDPNNNFNQTNNITVDTSAPSTTDWVRLTIEIDLSDPLLEGQILQFGFNNTSTNDNPSGVFYDNVVFELTDP